MNAREFFYLTAQMRDAQRDYFKTRSQQDLRRARYFEQTIDNEIQRVRLVLGALELDGNDISGGIAMARRQDDDGNHGG